MVVLLDVFTGSAIIPVSSKSCSGGITGKPLLCLEKFREIVSSIDLLGNVMDTFVSSPSSYLSVPISCDFRKRIQYITAVSTSHQQAVSPIPTGSFIVIVWNVVSKANQCNVWEKQIWGLNSNAFSIIDHMSNLVPGTISVTKGCCQVISAIQNLVV